MSTEEAEQLENNEQYEKAYEEYKRQHIKKPKNVDVLEKLGHIALILGKTQEAGEYYSKIIELEPTHELAYQKLMDIYVDSDRYKYYVARGNFHILQKELHHAITDFKKALDKAQTEEENNTTRFELATLYEQVGKNHKAIDEYLRILDTEALNEAVFLNLARVYVKEDFLPSAVEILERAIEKGFESNELKETLAQICLKNNEPEKARKFTENQLVKVKSLLEEEKNEEAFSVLNEIKNEYKNNAQYHLLLAQYYFNTDKWEESLNCVNDFDKYQKNSPLTYQMRALIYEGKGEDFNAHINWAKYNMLRGDKDVALNEYYLADRIDSENETLIRDIAELLDDMNDEVQACEFWERLVGLNSQNKRALEKLSDFRESIGDYAGASDFLEKLYELDKRNPVIIKRLANAYEKTKNKLKAIEYYNLFIKISANNDNEAEKIRVKLQKMENTEMEEDEGLLEKIIKIFSKK